MLLFQFRHGRHLSQPTLPRLVVEMDRLYRTLVACHIRQRRRVKDRGLLPLKPFFSHVWLAVYDLRLRTPCRLYLACLWRVLLHYLPLSVLPCARRQLVRRDFNKPLTVWIWDEVARWEYFGMYDRLQTMIVCIVVDLAVDLVLDNLVLMGFDDFMYDGWNMSD